MGAPDPPAAAGSARGPGVWEHLATRLSPAEERPRVCLDDLEIAHFQTRAGVPYAVVKHRVRRTYLRLSQPELDLLPLMDGTRTVRVLVVEYFLRYRVLAFQRVAGLVNQLRRQALVATPPVPTYQRLGQRLRRLDPRHDRGRLSAAHRVAGWLAWLGTWLTGREIVVDGLDRWVRTVDRAGGWLLFTPFSLLVAAGLAMAGAAVFAVNLGANAPRLFRLGDSYAAGLVLLLLVGVVSTAVHELGHALALVHAGREVRRGGFLLYFGLPTFFVDTTDVWMAEPRARLAVSWAGPYTALVLGGLASLGAVLAGPGALGDVLFAWALASYVDVLVNLNPLLELDGYYLLVDALERPLLRQDALAFARGPLWRRLGRGRGTRFTPDERLLAIFGVACAAWSLVSIWLALYLWERRIASLLRELQAAENPLARGVLAALVVGLLALVAAALVTIGRRAWPWVSRHSAILARATRALRQRERVALLRALPFLADLPPAALVEIAALPRPVHVTPGESVITQGDDADAFYLVRHGSLEVVHDGDAIARLGPGAYFGETALLHDVPRTATVRALSDCDLFAMRGADFRAALAHELGTFQRLREQVEARAELAALPLLVGLASEELDLLLAKLDERTYPTGAEVVRQGEPGDRFYIVRTGSVAVLVGGEAVNSLGPGEYFGEIALLRDVPRTATVAAGPEGVRTWSLDRQDFHDVLARYLRRGSLLEDTGEERLRHLDTRASMS